MLQGGIKMKKTYETPVMEVIAFDSEDIITTSGNITIDPNPDVPDFGDEFE